MRTASPNFALLRRVECRGVILTAPADPGTDIDVISRFFAPV